MIHVDVYVESSGKLQEQKWNVGSLVWLVPYMYSRGWVVCSLPVASCDAFLLRNNDRLTSTCITAALFAKLVICRADI